MERKKLPIGIQTFAKIRREHCYYVDKTPFVARLAEDGGYYFLSRPRRFGKSLFLDTLAEAFAGSRELFTGLYLQEHWDWDSRHPVIRISFAEGRLECRADLDRRIRGILRENAERLQVGLDDLDDTSGSFGQLITRAAEKHKRQAVVLVDEYDKPILDNLTDPDTARAMREGLRNLYSVLKGRDADLRFVFLTGVSKFSKVSLFSGLNNLYDLTLDASVATICGYTEDDLDTVFAPEFAAAAQDGQPLSREIVRAWYNGYRWGSEASVYNPFDVLLLLRQREFRAWWFETATPTFLVEWLMRHQFFTPRLERLYASEALLSAFDVDRIEPEALLWQTGYLTIHASRPTPAGPAYFLGVPNHEVRTALNEALLTAWLPAPTRVREAGLDLYDWLAQGDTEAVHGHFQRLFASIPADWYRKSPIAQYEGYFASVFYSHLASLGLSIIPEDISSHGRCDLAVRYEHTVWVFEFKVVDGEAPTGAALTQLRAKNYAAKYRAPGITVIEVGVEFSTAKRQIVGWEVALA
ncbi:ATPase AAA [Thermodesulfomicrobium sp. WS]|uniref:ATP-binding protein n=1 Tax=Thermodesulfomicrobium sp. WS TaxID=3004129 RepID=UPI00248FEEA9|nr:ATP-binding protein [Thermodesulfomicrobium sp. WS]BDV00506.1 ATPase AAA [Thermodesulfomicrobium sp. WS]